MKVWITKYALSAGIQEREAELCENQPNMIEVKGPKNVFNTFFHSEGKDWHRSKANAVHRAYEMREGKIGSLRKQIDKLQRLTFE